MGDWDSVVFRLDGNMDIGGSWSSDLAGMVPRSVLDRRGGAETSRGAIRGGWKGNRVKEWEN